MWRDLSVFLTGFVAGVLTVYLWDPWLTAEQEAEFRRDLPGGRQV